MRAATLIQLTAFLVLLSMAGAEATAQTNSSESVSLRQKPSDLLAGEFWGICYSGYRTGQHPDRGQGAKNPTDEQMLEDLRILTTNGFKLIRLYDAQTNSATVLRLIEKHQLDIKVLLGAWLSAEISNTNCPWQRTPYPDSLLAANRIKNEQEIQRAIALAKAHPRTVVAVSVGNEALVDWNDHMVTVESIIRYVRQVKREIRQPVTVADNYLWWAQHGTMLARELDFVSIHTYPVWEGKDINEAMPFTIANLEMVRKALPESRIVITEAGWATVASEFGARASEAKQKRYYQDMFKWAKTNNIATLFFEAFDEDWKGDANPLGAEKHWGLFTVNRKPKMVMEKFYPQTKH
jgi:exo-beta-1,3-glucanase (GH17 family)